MVKELEGEDNMMDFKEYMVLLGCLSMFCNDFSAKDHGATGQRRARIKLLSPPQPCCFICTGVTGMGVLGTFCLGDSWATQKSGGVGDTTVMA